MSTRLSLLPSTTFHCLRLPLIPLPTCSDIPHNLLLPLFTLLFFLPPVVREGSPPIASKSTKSPPPSSSSPSPSSPSPPTPWTVITISIRGIYARVDSE
ncbi:hypothetical protein DFH05DRAFT_1521378 [Lentinula detonsa]|uniref:Uncharacterized protein n=1 Tax=Lentinula detonsa TaxID=2804962 RepID=A0A9W8P4U3_9AGAR|nr:hypothetical protein DFH05DRAFT_1521378 [Lentinula detonsa]